MSEHHIPRTLAEQCVMRILEVPSIEAWEAMCLEASLRQGAGPMIDAARMWMPLGHFPEARAVMRRAASARMEVVKLLSSI